MCLPAIYDCNKHVQKYKIHQENLTNRVKTYYYSVEPFPVLFIN